MYYFCFETDSVERASDFLKQMPKGASIRITKLETGVLVGIVFSFHAMPELRIFFTDDYVYGKAILSHFEIGLFEKRGKEMVMLKHASNDGDGVLPDITSMCTVSALMQ